MLELFVIPTILLFGLGFLLWDITDSNDDEFEGELPNEPPITFFRLTDDDDTFEGEPGNQIVFSLGGNDSVSGGTGDDELILGSGDDKSFVSEPTGEINIFQFLGDDALIGGAGNDQLIDTLGSNQLFGGDDTDVLIAVDDDGDTPDSLSGGAGNDELTGDFGDTFVGGEGEDIFRFVANAQTGNPATILDYEDNEELVIQLSLSDQGVQASSQLSNDGNNIEITVYGETLVVLAGFTDLNAVNTSVQFV